MEENVVEVIFHFIGGDICKTIMTKDDVIEVEKWFTEEDRGILTTYIDNDIRRMGLINADKVTFVEINK